jgi:hypothetical protein
MVPNSIPFLTAPVKPTAAHYRKVEASRKPEIARISIEVGDPQYS